MPAEAYTAPERARVTFRRVILYQSRRRDVDVIIGVNPRYLDRVRTISANESELGGFASKRASRIPSIRAQVGTNDALSLSFSRERARAPLPIKQIFSGMIRRDTWKEIYVHDERSDNVLEILN